MKKKYVFSNIFYLVVHKRLHERYGRTRQVTKKNFFGMLGGLYHVPKKFRLLILKEMELLGMITPINKRDGIYQVNSINSDPEKNINQFYQELGMF